MAETLDLQLTRSGNGRVITNLNGKTYQVLTAYKHSYLDGYFFIVVTGRIPLRHDDLADKWRVVRAGDIYIAFALRAFSYHLCQGENAETPLGCNWPGLKAAPPRYAVVGPSEESVYAQVRLIYQQYRPDQDADALVERIQQEERGWWARNECSSDGTPRAILLTL